MLDTQTQKSQKSQKIKTRVFVDWVDSSRGPAWCVTGWMTLPVDDEDERDDDEPIVEVVYGSLM